MSIGTRIAFKTLTLSETTWTDVPAPITCNWFFIHVIGTTKPSFLISANTPDPSAQDKVESNWSVQVPMGPGIRWQAKDYMFSLKAGAGAEGMLVGITFLL